MHEKTEASWDDAARAGETEVNTVNVDITSPASQFTSGSRMLSILFNTLDQIQPML
jgi:hypothetical protein